MNCYPFAKVRRGFTAEVGSRRVTDPRLCQAVCLHRFKVVTVIQRFRLFYLLYKETLNTPIHISLVNFEILT